MELYNPPFTIQSIGRSKKKQFFFAPWLFNFKERDHPTRKPALQVRRSVGMGNFLSWLWINNTEFIISHQQGFIFCCQRPTTFAKTHGPHPRSHVFRRNICVSCKWFNAACDVIISIFDWGSSLRIALRFARSFAGLINNQTVKQVKGLPKRLVLLRGK